MNRKLIIPFNADSDNCSRSLLSGCYKFYAATLLRQGGASMTSIIEVYEYLV